MQTGSTRTPWIGRTLGSPLRLSIRRACGVRGGSRSSTVDPEPMAANGQRYASPDASICEARASACVSIYSRMFVSLPCCEDGDGEDEMVLERPGSYSFDLPLGESSSRSQPQPRRALPAGGRRVKTKAPSSYESLCCGEADARGAARDDGGLSIQIWSCRGGRLFRRFASLAVRGGHPRALTLVRRRQAVSEEPRTAVVRKRSS